MKIHFFKMHGLGNDFMVIDGINQDILLDNAKIRAWGDRHTGVGFDQLLLLQKTTQADCDFFYRIFNADGSEVAQCGNGARCIARFVATKKLSNKTKLKLQTLHGSIETELQNNNTVKVNMGVPHFAPRDIPFVAEKAELIYKLTVGKQATSFSALSLGNPHAVLFVDNVATAPVLELGEAFQHDAHFPKQVNVGFEQIIDKHTIKLRVFERGAGETQACGSGACAAVVAGQRRGLLDESVKVQLTGGDLTIDWQGEGQPVFMTGPAEFVFEGVI